MKNDLTSITIELSSKQVKLLRRSLAELEDNLDSKYWGNKNHPQYAGYLKALERIEELESLLLNR